MEKKEKKIKIEFSEEELFEIQNMLKEKNKKILNEKTTLINRNEKLKEKEKQLNLFDNIIAKIGKEIDPQCQI